MATLTPIAGRKRKGYLQKLISECGIRIIAIATALGFGNVISISYPLLVKLTENEWLLRNRMSAILGTQAIIILIVICIPLREPNWIDEEDPEEWTGDRAEALREVMKTSGYENNPKGWAKAKAEADSASSRYQNVWKGLWFSWFILYLILAYKSYPGICPDLSTTKPEFPLFQRLYFLDIASDLSNNVATLMILFCFFILATPDKGDNSRKYRKSQSNYYGWIAMVIVFTVLEAVVVGSKVHILDAAYYDLADLSTLRASYTSVTEAFKLISGLGAATIMALYFGRLNSRFLRTPVTLLVLFYLYAAIQPSYPRVGIPDSITIAIFIAVLILKCLWFVYVALLIESGLLQFYFVRVRSLNRDVGKEFDTFEKLQERAS